MIRCVLMLTLTGLLGSPVFAQKVAKVRFVLLASSYDGKFKAASNQLNYRAN